MTVHEVLVTMVSHVLTNQLQHVDTDVARVRVTWLAMVSRVSVQPISRVQQVLHVTAMPDVNLYQVTKDYLLSSSK